VALQVNFQNNDELIADAYVALGDVWASSSSITYEYVVSEIEAHDVADRTGQVITKDIPVEKVRIRAVIPLKQDQGTIEQQAYNHLKTLPSMDGATEIAEITA